MAKAIRVSSDGSTFYKLPGNTGSFSVVDDEIEDTIFGQSYRSNEAGLINWAVSANALYKGFAGYLARILRTGTATVMTDEPMTLESGQIYRITDITKEVWNRNETFVVEDDN